MSFDIKVNAEAEKASSAGNPLLTEEAYVKCRFVDAFTAANGRIGMNFEVTYPERLAGCVFRDYFGVPTGDLEDNKKVWPFWRALIESAGKTFKKGMKLTPALFDGATLYCHYVDRDSTDSGYDAKTWLVADRWQRRYDAFEKARQTQAGRQEDVQATTVDTDAFSAPDGTAGGTLDDLDNL